MLRNLRYLEDGAILADYVEEDASRRLEPGDDLFIAATSAQRPFGEIAVFIPPEHDPIAEKEAARAAMSASSLQLRLAAGHEKLVSGTFVPTWEEEQMLEYAGEVRRLSQTAATWGRALGLDDDALDALFLKAVQTSV